MRAPQRAWDAAWVAAILLISAGLCWPLAGVDWFQSDEGDGYVTRTIQYASELERGRLYPRWAPDFYGGYGSPFFVFYAPLVFAIAGVLSLFVDVLSALKVVAFLATAAAGIGTYGLVRGETRRDDAALLGAALYLTAPYRLADLYGRGDLAELLAIGLLPGVLALYRAAARAHSAPSALWFGMGAALLHAGMILSHTILGLWGTGVAAVVALATLLGLARRRAARRALSLSVAWVSALGLSLAYTGPALLEKSSVRVEAMVAGYYEVRNRWLPLTALLEPGRYDLRVLCGMSLLAPLSCLWLPRRAPAALVWTLSGIALAALCLPAALPIWNSGVLPFARFVQFPWRLLGPASLLLATGAGVAFATLTPRPGVLRPLSVALCGGALLLSLPALHVTPLVRAGVRDTPEAIRASVTGATGVNEYLPKKVTGAPQVASPSLVRASEHTTVREQKSNGSRHELLVRAERPARVDLALHDYPRWRVTTLAGPAKALSETSEAGLVRIRLPESGEYRLGVAFTDPPSRLAFSLASLSIAVLLWPALRVALGLGWPRASDPGRAVRWSRLAEGAR